MRKTEPRAQEPERKRRIFAVLGVLPEPGGYGIAKFSRSSTPYQQWITDLTQEGAQRFYETFYFDYGHASIADLAHLTLVLENISMVAAEELWDEPLLDGQASSTRYQDFERRGAHTPEELAGSPWEAPYHALSATLIREYKAFHAQILTHLLKEHASERPADMDDAKYERTLRARAYDVARYMLPMGIRTGLGLLLSARTLERQLVRLFSHPLQEVQTIARELKAAAVEQPAFNPMVERLQPLLEELETRLSPDDARSKEILRQIRSLTWFGAVAAPTLVKYTQPSEYLIQTREALAELADPYAAKLGEPDGRWGVQLSEPQDQLSERVCTLFYRSLPHSYAQIARLVREMNSGEKRQILERILRDRGRHDPVRRELRTGYELIFDLCLDGGAWRDFHRHRRLVQINKDLHAGYGYDTPKELELTGLQPRYAGLMEEAGRLSFEIESRHPLVGQYALPFAYRRRALLKMDAEELQYIVELRTRPENHFSVRAVAYAMFEEFGKRYPEIARHFRAVHPAQEEFFKR
jgi:thymidylate synthase ThyX